MTECSIDRLPACGYTRYLLPEVIIHISIFQRYVFVKRTNLYRTFVQIHEPVELVNHESTMTAEEAGTATRLHFSRTFFEACKRRS
jgi:hypothetical protein